MPTVDFVGFGPSVESGDSLPQRYDDQYEEQRDDSSTGDVHPVFQFLFLNTRLILSAIPTVEPVCSLPHRVEDARHAGPRYVETKAEEKAEDELHAEDALPVFLYVLRSVGTAEEEPDVGGNQTHEHHR